MEPCGPAAHRGARVHAELEVADRFVGEARSHVVEERAAAPEARQVREAAKAGATEI